MSEYRPPEIPHDLYARHGLIVRWMRAIADFVGLSLLFGLVIVFAVMAAGGSTEVAYLITACIAAGMVWTTELAPPLRARAKLKAQFLSEHRAQWEAEQRRSQSRTSAKADYGPAYAAYLPKWQAWHAALKAYEKEFAAYEAWRPKFVTAWQAYRERGVKAAKLFETIHENVEKRGRLELELSKPEHLTALFREAISVAAKAHPDLGMLGLVGPKVSAKEPPPRGGPYSPLTRKELEEYDWQVFPVVEGGRANHRQVNPLISHNMPELAYLLDDPRLEAVRDLLPPMPAIEKAAHEQRTQPTKPTRPPPPEGVIFYRQHVYGDMYIDSEDAAPVPPDKVVWS